MIQTKEEFVFSRTLLIEANERLSASVASLGETHSRDEVTRLTDPQVSFLMGIHEEVEAFHKDNAGELAELEVPPSAADLRKKLLEEKGS